MDGLGGVHMNVDALLKAAKFERCGPMHGSAFVHPETLEIKPVKQARPWWAVRPTEKAVFVGTPAAYLQSLVTPGVQVTPPDPVVLPSDAPAEPVVETPVTEEETPKPRRVRKPKAEAVEGAEAAPVDGEPKAKRVRRKKIEGAETPESSEP
jgi:hypothetical protein